MLLLVSNPSVIRSSDINNRSNLGVKLKRDIFFSFRELTTGKDLWKGANALKRLHIKHNYRPYRN